MKKTKTSDLATKEQTGIMPAMSTKRVPRPLGMTAVATSYQKEPSESNLMKLYSILLASWTTNNGSINGTHYSINQLSYKFNIPTDIIQVYMKDKLLSSRMWDSEKQTEMFNALMGEQISWMLEDRMEVNHQLELLKASQKNHYTPFVSAEVSKLLDLRLKSSGSLQSIIKSMTGTGNINIFQQFNQQNNEQNIQEGISIEDARIIVQEANKELLADKSQEAKLLETNYDLDSLPVIIANEQEMNNGKESTNFKVQNQELKQITDDYKGAIEISSREHHEQRREIEERIDPYEEDPEMFIELGEEYMEPESDTDNSIARAFLNP